MSIGDIWESYRIFALGVLSLAEGDAAEGHRQLTLAARERIENFDSVLRVNFESFQLPSLVDKILIGIGLASAMKSPATDTAGLLLQASELLGRNLRHQVVDTASMLSRQPDDETQSDAHSYTHLIGQKREWELKKIQQLLANEKAASDKGNISFQYNSAISTLVALKQKLRSRLQGDAGLPGLSELQKALKEGEAFITHLPVLGGTGKLCVTHDETSYSVSQPQADIAEKMRELAIAVTTPPRRSEDLSQFPAASAVEIYNFLFSGLEACLKAGMHVTVAVPPELASIPFGALLRTEPPKTGAGFDLRKAQWLIRDISFSTVISARHFLAIKSQQRRAKPTRPFLGVGDPILGNRPPTALPQARVP